MPAQRYLLALALVAAALSPCLQAQAFKDAITLYIDGESKAPKAPVQSIASSIRQRPGKFGKAFLIERRTVNYAIPQEMVLGDGATIKGKSNLLSLPDHGFAAIPQTGLRANASNFLSFTYRLANAGADTAKITVVLAENGTEMPLATLDARKDIQKAAVRFFSKSDAASLKLRSEKAVLLDEVMVDRNIDFANSYHAPGPARNVDVIRVSPKGVFNPASGAVSFWLNAPWFRPGGEGSGLAILDVLTKLKQTKKFGDNFAKVISIWGGKDVHGVYDPYMIDINKGIKTSVNASFRMSEIPDMAADGWVHVAICWELKNGIMTDTVYLNGHQATTRSGAFVPFEDCALIEIGYSGGSYTNGMLDDFAMFSRPLTPAEVKAIADSATPLCQMTDKSSASHDK